jgi:hypothetical protein
MATVGASTQAADHETAEWQAAMKALQHGGPTMFARIGMMRVRC